MTKLLRRRWALSRPPDVPFTINRASSQAVRIQAWWPTLASRGAGVLRDLSGHGHDGAFPGAAANPSWVTDAQRGVVLSFDGGDYIQVPDHSDLDITGNITFGLWIKTPGSATWDVILSKGAYNSAYTLHLSDGNVIHFCVAGTERSTGITVSLNEWVRLDVTHDGEYARLYVNGVQEYSIADADATTTNADSLYIGREAGGNDYLGLIDDARVYPRALTAAEIWQIYDQATRWELYRPLVRQWQLKAPTAPPTGQPIHLRALAIPHMCQWQPRVAS